MPAEFYWAAPGLGREAGRLGMHFNSNYAPAMPARRVNSVTNAAFQSRPLFSTDRPFRFLLPSRLLGSKPPRRR